MRRMAAFAVVAFAEASFYAFIWVFSTPACAYAYVDPSVMTYTIQALAGVAVALSAVAGVVFRRIRRKVFATLGVDENANKAVEGDISRIDPDSAHASAEFEAADRRAEALKDESERDIEKIGLSKLRWRRRFAYALLMSVFAFFIILIAPSLEIFGANEDSLVFRASDIWWVTVGVNLLFAVASAFALSALKGKAFMRALLAVFCIAMAAYVQSFFLNSGMQPADGGFIGWHEWYFVRKMIVSGIIWVLILVVPQILSRRHNYAWLRATCYVAVAVFIMQGVGVASVFLDGSGSGSDSDVPERFARTYVTQKGLYELHPESNVVVFVLDTFDTQYIEDLLSDDPDVLKEFDGFTYFKNSAGMMVPTANALPYLLTGEKPRPDEDMATYRAQRYERGGLIPSIHEAGYSVDIYSDTMMLDFSHEADRNVAEIVGNMQEMDRPPIDFWETYLALDQCALYREAPWAFKPWFWYYTTDVNNRMIASSSDGGAEGVSELYELDDAGILATLKENGLSLADQGEVDSKGAFKLIHLFGPHFPFNIDENGVNIGTGKSNQWRQARGTLRVVEQYLQEMKKLGVYDRATIIVMADHGIWTDRDDPVSCSMSPLLLVKPSMPDGANQPGFAISEAPVSHADFAPTVVDAVGGDPSMFGEGLTVWDVQDNGRVRYFDVLTNAGEGGRRIVEYAIEGDVFDLDNWKKTGNEWRGAPGP